MEDFLKSARVRATLLVVLFTAAAGIARKYELPDLEALLLALAGGAFGKEYLVGSKQASEPTGVDLPRYQRHD